MYQPPAQKSVGASPFAWSQSASVRTRSTCSGPGVAGLAWPGETKWVWWPSGPCSAAWWARSSQRSSSSPAAASGGRISAAMRNPPGCRAWSAANRDQHASSSGRSTWQEQTAYRLAGMCGICGLLAPSGTADPSLVSRMNAALVHRGPDEGSVEGFGRCVLGHRRLQVIDLETGSQPVTNEAGDVVAVFNGELYNFRELRAALSAHEVRGTGDTPVIPH